MCNRIYQWSDLCLHYLCRKAFSIYISWTDTEISMLLIFSFLKDFIYLFMRDTEKERLRHRQREKQAPCREPDVGLNPGTPGSCPGPKAGAHHWATQGSPDPQILFFFKYFIIYSWDTHTHTQRGRDTGRGRSRLHAGSLMWDSILGLQDQALGWRRR